MIFYKLTDPIRSGDIIRAEGRKHYSYSFGVCRWVRTTVMMAYMNPDSPLYGMYEQVSEQEAQELVIRKSAVLARLLPKAEALARQYHEGQTDKAGAPYVEHLRSVASMLDDLEQKITAWLHDLCEDTGATFELLLREGFTPRIVQAVRILTKPTEMDYYDYIRRVRTDPIARAVKLADLSHNMDLSRLPNPTDRDRERLEKYRKAYAYLNLEGELPERASPQVEEPRLVPSLRVFEKVSAQALQGKKLPHGVSNPVLRREDGTLYLAFFVYLYQKRHLDERRLPRPSGWLLADLASGEIVKRFSCAERDFSSQPQDALYSVDYPDKPAYTREQFAELYGKLDRARAACAGADGAGAQEYAAYFEAMLELVPPAYRVFYQDLSRL